jgi:hypothetical protein
MSAALSLPPADALVRIPLVRTMLEDPCVRFDTRAIDHGWSARGIGPMYMNGFNAATGAVFVAARSPLAQWLSDPYRGGRALNQEDRLVRELMFAVHDYLHVWSYRLIRELRPELRFGDRPDDPTTIEDHVFCHLVTEAVATVGLDYWYLSAIDLNEVVDIGTAFTTLTVSFHERYMPEYRRFAPELVTQRPSFFRTVADAYCRGTFSGFRARDAMQSPLLLRWMQEELTYGARQRTYAREWFSYLAGVPSAASARELARPVTCDEAWKRDLVDDVAAALWAKVKEGHVHRFGARSAVDRAQYDELPQDGLLDFRFVNVGRITLDDPTTLSRSDHRPSSIEALLHQIVVAHERDGSVPDAAMAKALATRDVELVRTLLARSPLVEGDERAPTLLLVVP